MTAAGLGQAYRSGLFGGLSVAGAVVFATFMGFGAFARDGGLTLLEAVLIPVAEGRRTSRFLKLGQRRYLVISAVMVAGGITWWLFDSGPLASSGSTSLGIVPTADGGSMVQLGGTF